jgi:hypothetical protein
MSLDTGLRGPHRRQQMFCACLLGCLGWGRINGETFPSAFSFWHIAALQSVFQLWLQHTSPNSTECGYCPLEIAPNSITQHFNRLPTRQDLGRAESLNAGALNGASVSFKKYGHSYSRALHLDREGSVRALGLKCTPPSPNVD